jgi:hypothetical protein
MRHKRSQRFTVVASGTVTVVSAVVDDLMLTKDLLSAADAEPLVLD